MCFEEEEPWWMVKDEDIGVSHRQLWLVNLTV